MLQLRKTQFLSWRSEVNSVFSRQVDVSPRSTACWAADGRTFSRAKVLDILGSGAAKWNRWLASLPHIQWPARGMLKYGWLPGYLIDIRKIDFRKFEFDGYYFASTNLSESKFTQSIFRQCSFVDWPGRTLNRSASVKHCDFRSAKFISSDFGRSDFSNCDFSRGEFNGVKFARTELANSKFFRAIVAAEFFDSDLTNVDFSEAHFLESEFANTDLSRCKNLDKANYHGHLRIDHRTLFRSGVLPFQFYRGAGFPEILIDYLPSLVSQPIQHYSCFISYSVKNEDLATRIYSELQSNSVRCWFSPHDLRIGARTRGALDEAIRSYDKLLVILSRESINSDWVEFEVETALEQERREGRTILFPIRVDDAVFRTSTAWARHICNTRNIGDFTKWKEPLAFASAFDRLLRDLRKETEVS